MIRNHPARPVLGHQLLSLKQPRECTRGGNRAPDDDVRGGEVVEESVGLSWAEGGDRDGQHSACREKDEMA